MKHLINFRTQTTHLGDKNGVKHAKNIFLFVKSYNEIMQEWNTNANFIKHNNSTTIDDY